MKFHFISNKTSWTLYYASITLPNTSTYPIIFEIIFTTFCAIIDVENTCQRNLHHPWYTICTWHLIVLSSTRELHDYLQEIAVNLPSTTCCWWNIHAILAKTTLKVLVYVYYNMICVLIRIPALASAHFTNMHYLHTGILSVRQLIWSSQIL